MKKILVIAPHPDDEILGCGGTMIKNIKEGNEVYVCIVTKGYPPLFNAERTELNRKDTMACHKAIGVKETFYLDFPSTQLETVPRFEFNGKILDVVRRLTPDEVYIPHWGDMQKDHQIVAEACMVAVRPKYMPQVKRVYGYETMSETAWNAPNIQNEFIPNVFVDISDTLEEKKMALSYFKLQVSDFPDARSLEAIEALAKYRGALMNLMAAEAFMLIREIR
jgi:LmbE family N-acetylglucosaminyl deacetylase